ncbi:MAG: hypothetical protein AAGI07_15740 [Bacteroidota bacterium]
MQQNELIAFTYSAKKSSLSFFSDFNFTTNISPKSLDFLISLDNLNEEAKVFHSDIIFLEETASLSDTVINALQNASKVYLILDNKKEQVKEKLFKKLKGNMHRKVISDTLDLQVSNVLLTLMGKAYKKRDSETYTKVLAQFKMLFTSNSTLEVKLNLLNACNTPQKLKSILDSQHEDRIDLEQITLSKILKKTKIKNLLHTLASEELPTKEARINARKALYQEIHY